MTILLTGQCGYIGSHIALDLIKRGLVFVGLDNLSTGLMSNNYGPCVIGDITRKEDIEQVFENNDIDLVIHLAALTSVPESYEKKKEYIEVNVEGTVNLIKVMKEHNCNKLIFSSTASVYKQSNMPLKEQDVVQPKNNYAATKCAAEQYIKNQDWLNYIIFRYFNVIGYDEQYDQSKEAGKTNIIPTLMKILKQSEPKDVFKVYGNGYPVTREDKTDHTCVRDYIDVRDISRAHVDAIRYMIDKTENNKPCKTIFNLGTKHGTSVLELLKAFEKANGIKIEYEIVEPRKGDPASLIADNQKARELLNWCHLYPLEDSLRYQKGDE